MRQGDEVKVWDPLVRVLHWTLVAGFTLAYLSAEAWEGLHHIAGYMVAAAVALRLVWGLVGSPHARFTDFVRGPQAVAAYLRRLLSLHPPRYLGHNPAGGAMIVALLVMLALTATSGMAVYAVQDHRGPLAGLLGGLGPGWEDPLEALHELAANTTLGLVCLHVAGVLVESLLHGENLVRAMWTGYKRAGGDAETG